MNASVSADVLAPDVSTRLVRVAHVYSSLGIYGAERWALTLIKYLDRAKVESIVVTIGTKPGAYTFHKFLVQQGVRAAHLAIPGKLSLLAIRALRQLLLRERIDIVHCHGFKSDILGYLSSCGTPIRTVSTLHGWSAHEGLRIRLYESLGRLFLRRFDRVYPVSPGIYDDLLERRFAAGKVALILNGVDLAPFEACYQNRSVRRPGDPFHVLFAGRLCKPKGVRDLIRGFAIVRGVPAQLRIVGEGPDRQLLERLACQVGATEAVQFSGAVDSILPHLEWADVLVLPSYSEGIPRTVMEAFAAGVPVIGTDIPGIRALIEPMQTGLLVAPGNPHAIASALDQLAHQPHLGESLAFAARARIEHHFSARRVAADYTAEYRSLTAQ